MGYPYRRTRLARRQIPRAAASGIVLPQCVQYCPAAAGAHNRVSGHSTGVYGYPKDQAAQIALAAARAYENRFDLIILCSYSDLDKAIYDALLASR